MGQRGAALASIEEAVGHYRQLVESNRDAFLPDLAMSHGAWGATLLAAEDASGAAEKFAEGVRLITPLALELPQAHFELAVRLARAYAQACEVAGIEPDEEAA
jgi:hypothetical protein